MNVQDPSDDRRPFLASLNAVPVCKRRMSDTDWFPAVDVAEAAGAYLFEFDLPGVSREQIQISLDGNTLHLAGIRTTQQHGGKNLRAERPSGAFVRRLVLPPDACGDEMHAALAHGILELRIPRKTPVDAKVESKIIHLEKHNTPNLHT